MAVLSRTRRQQFCNLEPPLSAVYTYAALIPLWKEELTDITISVIISGQQPPSRWIISAEATRADLTEAIIVNGHIIPASSVLIPGGKPPRDQLQDFLCHQRLWQRKKSLISAPPERGDIPGLPARCKPRGTRAATFSEPAAPHRRTGGSPIRARTAGLRLPRRDARPLGCLLRGTREPGAPRLSARRPVLRRHLSRSPRCRTRGRGGRRERPGPGGCPGDAPPLRRSSAPRPASPAARPPLPRAAARALGPQQGRRTRRRRRRTYRARLALAAGSLRRRRVRPSRAHPQRSAKFKGAGRGGGARREGGRGRGGGVRQVLQLPSLPPAGRGGGGGGRRRARSANEFTFCPPRAPPPLPAGLLLGRRGPAGAVGSRRGSRRTAEGEQGGKERRRAGRRARSAIQDLKGALAGAQGRVCPRDQARTRVRVSRESPIPGEPAPAAGIYNPALRRPATCQDDRLCCRPRLKRANDLRMREGVLSTQLAYRRQLVSVGGQCPPSGSSSRTSNRRALAGGQIMEAPHSTIVFYILYSVCRCTTCTSTLFAVGVK
ncbi:uncharacterized protein [Manis javanica]|uniref:uncharacterized protein n=1 Tax=Manis javanica TaxID=9974 RepID=UPI003C6D5299